MGNFPIPDVLSANKFLTVISDFTSVLYGILSLLFLTVLIFFLHITYKKIRRKFPLKCNCWFCNNDANVPYELCNGWECPHCKQYNGFNKDGDYNKIIPEQYNYKLNEKIFNTLRTSVESRKSSPPVNGLCKLCNINQQLKIQQLALFVPLNENNYYKEIEEYREKLERAYQLCSNCEKTLKETLEKQEYKLLQDRLNYHKHSICTNSLENFTRFKRDDLIVLFKKHGVLGLKVIQVIIALILFLALIVQYETENQFLKLTLPELEILESLLPYLKIHYQENVYQFKKELSFTGLVCCFLTYFEFLVNKSHFVLLAWGILHITLWTFYTGVHVITSGACLFFTIQAAQYKFIQLKKKPLSKKSSFQPVKNVFPDFRDFQTSQEDNSVNKISSSLIKSDSFSSLEDLDLVISNQSKETKEKLTKLSRCENKKKKPIVKENEIESFPDNETEASSSSFMKKSYVSSPETDKNAEQTNEPFSEVFTNLNSLQLGAKQKKSNKPPNFLFANHNFSDGKNTSIIKPAKFIKNLNSSSWTESNECNSRSSTPSSGYFSQKPEKVEPSRYDFPKLMSPYPVNSFSRHSPNQCFDFYDGNHGFYNAVNCFSPGFVPFHQFPGTPGHTTIYTCTKPYNFSFPFSPWQGVPPQKFSPSSFSDSSSSDNLFRESCKKFAKNQQRLELKTILYYFSICFNFITIMGLVYFTSTGIVSVDWKLPKLNFFL